MYVHVHVCSDLYIQYLWDHHQCSMTTGLSLIVMVFWYSVNGACVNVHAVSISLLRFCL